MSHYLKPDPVPKYLNTMLRQETVLGSRKSLQPKNYQSKLSSIGGKPASVQKPKPNTNNVRNQKILQVINSLQKQIGDTNLKEIKKGPNKTRSRRSSQERDTWGNILKSKSKGNVANITNFDQLKKLLTKLQKTHFQDDEIFQMVSDLQLVLKRIPPEVVTVLNTSNDLKVATSNKTCQTPPTMYQEDTEKFQQILEENTFRLESSCKQLELVCTSLQQEKQATEKELEEANRHIEELYKQIKEKRDEKGSQVRINQLEQEKLFLLDELNKTKQEVNPALDHVIKLVDELKLQKQASDDYCAKLEHDLTSLTLEKEKIATMLSVRDKEIKDIQQEMSRIQQEVDSHLDKLNQEMLYRVNSLKTSSAFLDIGDTVSSFISSEGESELSVKKVQGGDAESVDLEKKSDDGDQDADTDVVSGDQDTDTDVVEGGDQETDVFEGLMAELSPSLKSLLAVQE